MNSNKFIIIILTIFLSLNLVNASQINTLTLQFTNLDNSSESGLTTQSYSDANNPKPLSRYSQLAIVRIDNDTQTTVVDEELDNLEPKFFILDSGVYNVRIYESKNDYIEYNNDSNGYLIQGNYTIQTYLPNKPYTIGDAPWRIEPNKNIPVIAFVKEGDEDNYPVYEIRIYDTGQFSNDGDDILRETIDLFGDGSCFGNDYEIIDEDVWYKIQNVNLSLFRKYSDGIHIKVVFDAVGNALCGWPNGDSVTEIKIRPSNYSYPRLNNWYSGDTHYHSVYTSNAVEFGNPIEATVEAGKAIGMDWVTITDHSFDLDSYMVGKDETWKWDQMEIDCNNYGDSTFKCIRGEEISTRRNDGKYIHYLAYDIDNYIIGEGCDGLSWPWPDEDNYDSNNDGWDNTAVTYYLSDVISQVNTQGGFGYGAHPANHSEFDLIGWAGNKLCYRGPWTNNEYDLNGYTGLQIWNQESNKENIDEYINPWIDQLLTGRRIFISGGNDAHGDFSHTDNNHLQKSNDEDAFGKVRTILYLPNGLTESGILNALKNGNSIMTDGPMVIFDINDTIIGDEINVTYGQSISLNVQYNSTPEFGALDNITIIKGVIGGNESILTIINPKKYQGTNNITDIPLNDSYYRLNVTTNDSYRAYTNPIWVNVLPDDQPPLLSLGSYTPVSNFNSSSNNITIEIFHSEINPDTLILSWNGTNESYSYIPSGTPGGGGGGGPCGSISQDSTGITINKSCLTDGAYSYYVWANDTFGNYNRTEPRTINIDTQSPQINFGPLTPVNNFNSSSVNITIEIDHYELNPDTLILSWNGINESYSYIAANSPAAGGGAGPCGSISQDSAGITINKSCLNDSTYSYYVWANDTSGNFNQTETRNINIDTMPPDLTCGWWRTENATISPNESLSYFDYLQIKVNDFLEPVNYLINIKNESEIVYSFSGQNTSILHYWYGNDTNNQFVADGAYEVELFAEDFAGNNITKFLGIVNIDNTNPGLNGSLSISKTPFNVNYSNKTTISVNSTEPVYWTAQVLNQSGSIIESLYSNSDASGIEFDWDKYGNLNLSNLVNETILKRKSDITIDCSAKGGGGGGGGNAPLTDILTPGNYSINIKITDIAGNIYLESEIIEVVNFPPDLTPPNIELYSPQNKTYNVSLVDFNYSVSEETPWIGYSLDNSENKTLYSNITLEGLANGSYCLQIYANDTAGNLGSSRVCFNVTDVIQNKKNITVGQNVFRNFTNSSVTLRFDNVTGDGNVSVSKMRGNPKSQTPSGFKAEGHFYDISTNARFSGNITLCVSGFDVQASHKLFHWEDGGWKDVTVDPTGNSLCGNVSSLSPIAALEEEPQQNIQTPPSGGGGGGGGGSDEATAYISKIEKGKSEIAKFSKKKSPYVSEIEISVNKEVYSVGLSLKYPSKQPYGTSDIDDEVFKFIEIKKSNTLKDDDIEKAVIKFKVEKEWLENNDINSKAVVLLRYINGQWEELDTSFENEDEFFANYSSVTQGFSYFAIVGKSGFVESEEVVVAKKEAGGGFFMPMPSMLPEVIKCPNNFNFSCGENEFWFKNKFTRIYGNQNLMFLFNISENAIAGNISITTEATNGSWTVFANGEKMGEFETGKTEVMFNIPEISSSILYISINGTQYTDEIKFKSISFNPIIGKSTNESEQQEKAITGFPILQILLVLVLMIGAGFYYLKVQKKN